MKFAGVYKGKDLFEVVICETCEHYKESDTISHLDGVCLLSKESNAFMVAWDEIQAYSPRLDVSKKFGCNQHKEKVWA